MTCEFAYPWSRHRVFPAPPLRPSDLVAHLEVDAIAADLALVAARLGVTPDGAYDAARRLEARQGYSARSRALQAVATANAAIGKARDAANGERCIETIAYRIKLAKAETDEAMVVMVKVT